MYSSMNISLVWEWRTHCEVQVEVLRIEMLRRCYWLTDKVRGNLLRGSGLFPLFPVRIFIYKRTLELQYLQKLLVSCHRSLITLSHEEKTPIKHLSYLYSNLGVGSFHAYNSLCTPYFPYLVFFLSDVPRGLTESCEIVSQYSFKQYNKVHTINKNSLKTSTWKY